MAKRYGKLPSEIITMNADVFGLNLIIFNEGEKLDLEIKKKEMKINKCPLLR